MFSYLSPEQRVRKDHPLRVIRRLTDEALQRLSRRFDQMYSWTGRPSIPPEKLLRALLLQILYTIRSERLLMEQEVASSSLVGPPLNFFVFSTRLPFLSSRKTES